LKVVPLPTFVIAADPSPEDMKETLNLLALVSALVLSVAAGGIGLFPHEDLVASDFRMLELCNSTMGNDLNEIANQNSVGYLSRLVVSLILLLLGLVCPVLVLLGMGIMEKDDTVHDGNISNSAMKEFIYWARIPTVVGYIATIFGMVSYYQSLDIAVRINTPGKYVKGADGTWAETCPSGPGISDFLNPDNAPAMITYRSMFFFLAIPMLLVTALTVGRGLLLSNVISFRNNSSEKGKELTAVGKTGSVTVADVEIALRMGVITKDEATAKTRALLQLGDSTNHTANPISTT
jgi:hypothetical protein